MSEHLRSTTTHQRSSERAPSVEDVRRKLEGRLEVLEAARERYVRLWRVLSLWGWERRLRRRPELVRTLLSEEPAYEAALERILRRAESEGWPEDAPGLALVRDVRARRARLEELVYERLAERVWTPGPASLVRDLERLELLARELVSLEPRPASSGSDWFGDGGLIGQGLLEMLGPLGFVVLLMGGLGFWWARKRGLAWRGAGSASEVPAEEVARAGHLAAAVELRRRLPALVTRVEDGHLSQVVCFAATLREGNGTGEAGHAVLRPDALTFLPEGTGPGALRALAGPESSPAPVPIEVPWLVEQLRYLPSGADFDASLARTAVAVGGRHWTLGPHSRIGLNGVEIHFAEDTCEVRGKVTGPALKVAGRLLFTRR